MLTNRVCDDFQGFWDPTSSISIVDVCVEERLNQGGFAQTRLTDNHHREMEAFFERFAMTLVGEIVETDEARETLLGNGRGFKGVWGSTARYRSG